MGKNRYGKMSRQLLTVRAHLFRVINRDKGWLCLSDTKGATNPAMAHFFKNGSQATQMRYLRCAVRELDLFCFPLQLFN